MVIFGVMFMRFICFLLVSLFSVLASYCCSPVFAVDLREYTDDLSEVLFQTSAIDREFEQLYESDVKLKEIKKHGDFGIGTFNGLHGELIALDNVFYQIREDGKAYIVKDSQKTPFAVVTYFGTDKIISLRTLLEFGQLKEYISERLPSVDICYGFKIRGVFHYIKARSVAKQEPPYTHIKKIIAKQNIFEFHDVKGILVGFKLPSFLNGGKTPGYHFHFITEDLTRGGHVIEMSLKDILIEVDYTCQAYVNYPNLYNLFVTDLSKGDSLEMEENITDY